MVQRFERPHLVVFHTFVDSRQKRTDLPTIQRKHLHTANILGGILCKYHFFFFLQNTVMETVTVKIIKFNTVETYKY